MSRFGRLSKKVQDFFLAPALPTPLAVLRIGVALVLLLQAFELRGSTLDLFGNGGIVSGDLARNFADPGAPTMSWITGVLAHLHLGEAASVQLVCGAYVVALMLLGLGLFSRVAAVIAWFLHWTLVNTGQTASYGVDLYAHVFLFYLMLAPAGQALSLDAWFKGVAPKPSSAARLSLRVMQLHMCISYLCSAVEKAQGPQWWNGELIWRALTLPEYRQFNMEWLANWPHLPMVLGWGSLVLEGGYFLMIWPKRTRYLWILGVMGLHLGITFSLGLTCFGLFMTVLTPALFGVPADPVREYAPAARSVVLFDGVCNLCDAFVLFLIRRDRGRKFAMASLQSEVGLKLRAQYGVQTGEELGSIVLIEDGQAWTRSTAVLRVLNGLPGLWPAAYGVFIWVPAWVRDPVYAWVARNRYRWFGRKDQCMMPTPELKSHFL